MRWLPPETVLRSHLETMIKLILLSNEVIWDSRNNFPRAGIIEGLSEAKADGVDIFLVSSHGRPQWLAQHFNFITFCGCTGYGRKSGKIVKDLIKLNEGVALKKSDFLVLGAKDVDFLMAVNSQALL